MKLVEKVKTATWFRSVKESEWWDKLGIIISLAGIAVAVYARSITLLLMWMVVLMQDMTYAKAKLIIKDRDEALEAQRKLIIRQDQLITSLEKTMAEKSAILYGDKHLK